MREYTYADVKHKINEVGLKATHQRIVIFQALVKLDNHPTAEQLFDLVVPNCPSISMGTLYKNLETLESTGLIEKVKSVEGSYRYDSKVTKHSHIYLTNTNEIIDYEDEDLDLLLMEYFKKKKIKNMEIKDVRLQIHAERTDLINKF